MNNTQKKNMFFACLSVLLGTIGFGAVAPYFPLFVKELGVETSIELWAGILFSSSYLTGAIAAPFWGSLSDKHGRKIMAIRASLSSTIIYFLISYSVSRPQLLILQLVVGALAGFVPASVAMIATSVPDEDIGKAIGYIYTSAAAGSVIGPLLGGLVANIGGIRNIFRIASALLLVTTLIVFLFINEEKKIVNNNKISVFKDLGFIKKNKNIIITLIALVGVQISMVSLNPVLSLHVEKILGTEKANVMTGFIFSSKQLALIIATPIWVKIGELFSFRKVLILGSFIGAIICFIQLMFNSITIMWLLFFCYGLFIAGLIPATNTILAKSVSTEYRGRVFGVTTTANQIGVFIGPIVSGYIAGFKGIKGVFIFMGIILLLTCLIVKENLTEGDSH